MLCYSAQSQVLYSWDFNSLPTGAINLDLDGATDVLENETGWFIKEIGAGTEHFALVSSGLSSSLDRGPVDHWLIIPNLNIDVSSILKCEFRASSFDVEHFDFYISTDGLEYEDFSKLRSTYTPNGVIGELAISLADFTGQNIHLALVHKQEEAGAFWLDNLKIEEVPANIKTGSSNAISRISFPYVYPGSYDVEMLVINEQEEEINSISVHYTLDNGETIESLTVPNVNNVNERCYISIPDLFDFSEAGIYDILLWTSSPNGIPEEDLSNDRQALQIVVLEQSSERKTLLEEFTADWCGFCTRAPIILEDVLGVVGEEKVVVSTFHGGDTALELPVFNELLSAIPNLVTGFPSGAVDRYQYATNLDIVAVAPEFWAGYISESLNQLSSVDISADIDYQTESRELEVTVNVDFVNIDEGEFKVHAYLTENRVVGYPQSNFYNQTMEFPSLYNLGDPIEDYAHNHVVRHMLSESLGDEGVIPSSVEAGDHYEKTYTYQIPEDFVVDHMQLVVYLTKNPTANTDVEQLVLNVEDYSFNEFSVNTKETTLDKNLSIYPNPADDYIHVQTSQEGLTLIKIVGIDGKHYKTIPNVKNNIQIDVSFLNPGVYSIISYRGDHLFHQRLVIK